MLYEYCLPHAKEVDRGGRSTDRQRERGDEREQIHNSGAETPPSPSRKTNWFLWHAPAEADVPAAYNLYAVSLTLLPIVILVAIEPNFESK